MRASMDGNSEHCAVNRGRGFTLFELLVVMFIIVLLLSILLPALSVAMSQSRSLLCKSRLKNTVEDFYITMAYPGTLRRYLPVNAPERTFGMTSYIDKFYQAGAYYPDSSERTVLDSGGANMSICPSSKESLIIEGYEQATASPPVPVYERMPGQSALINSYDVSYAFNQRLLEISRYGQASVRDYYVKLSPSFGDWAKATMTPLLSDADPWTLYTRGVLDRNLHMMAPPSEPNAGLSIPTYAPVVGAAPHGRKWFPSYRHRGRCNVARLDVSVHSLEDLLDESELYWADARYAGHWDLDTGTWVGAKTLLESYYPRQALVPIQPLQPGLDTWPQQ